MKELFKKGLVLLKLSIVYRIIAFIYFSFAWKFDYSIVRGLALLIGILFIFMWFYYGYKIKVGFKKGIIIGIIGASDGIILSIVTVFGYINRGSYYPGPLAMAPWVMPLVEFPHELINMNHEYVCILLVVSAVILTALGSLAGKIMIRKLVSTIND